MIAAALWKATLLGIRTKFSDVTHVQSNDVDGKMDDLKLFDCRDQNEYDVSRIPGSSHLDPNSTDEELKNAVGSLDTTTRIICYCSVGYRSSVMARRLKGLNDNLNVVNLEGSIFKWANESRPIVDANGKSTKLVHPYNSTWGQMLNHDLWSELG